MALPKKLKNFNLFNDGASYMGIASEVVLPKLTRKMEEYRAAGMTGPVMVDFGNEKLTLEFTTGGIVADALKQYGSDKHNGVQLRFAGAYQDDDTGEVIAAEVVVRGRFSEIDMGAAKMGGDTAHKYSAVCSYCKLTIAGADAIELDFMGAVENVGGADKTASIRASIGL